MVYSSPPHPHLMDRSRLIRGLRIAWSVWWGTLCVLLVVLWVRSHTWRDVLFIPTSDSNAVGLSSKYGGVTIRPNIQSPLRYFDVAPWHHRFKVKPGIQFGGDGEEEGMEQIRFGIVYRPYMTMYLPHWFLVSLSATLATAAWLPWKFSLRTLLIATTIITVGMG